MSAPISPGRRWRDVLFIVYWPLVVKMRTEDSKYLSKWDFPSQIYLNGSRQTSTIGIELLKRFKLFELDIIGFWNQIVNRRI